MVRSPAMPAPLLSKREVLDRLMEVFREQGYDGASLSEISAATGLGKSSLYHHFPGGKEDMALQVLAHLAEQLREAMFEPLRAKASPDAKLGRMLDVLVTFYEGGKKACLLERLAASIDRKRFRRPLERAFEAWIAAVEDLCVEAGLSRSVARARAEDLVVRVEGSLVLCAATGKGDFLERTVRDAKRSLLAPS
jgi:AcrR family transcriptional regulator